MGLAYHCSDGVLLVRVEVRVRRHASWHGIREAALGGFAARSITASSFTARGVSGGVCSARDVSTRCTRYSCKAVHKQCERQEVPGDVHR